MVYRCALALAREGRAERPELAQRRDLSLRWHTAPMRLISVWIISNLNSVGLVWRFGMIGIAMRFVVIGIVSNLDNIRFVLRGGFVR